MTEPFRDGETAILITTLARRVGRHLGTVHVWRKRGKLEAIRIGGLWHVTPAAWGRFIERCNPPGLNDHAAPARTDKQRETEQAQDEARAVALGL
jgi:hypothetical protein